MIRDAQLQFSAAQALPNSGVDGTLESTNVIDTGIAGKGFNTNKPLILYIQFSGTMGATSLLVSFVSSAAAALTSPRYHWSSGVIAAASYAAQGFASGGAPILIAMPHSWFNPTLLGTTTASAPYLQYLGMIYTAVGDLSAGLVTAGLVEAADMRTYAASGYTMPTI